MFIYEIVKPGTWLDYEDRNWTWEVDSVLRGLESQFYEANLSLNLFLHVIQQKREFPSSEQFRADAQPRSEIRKEVERKYENPHDHEVYDEIHFEVEVIFKREKWQSGKLPREFEHNQQFLHARSFLYSLDAFDKFLGVLGNMSNSPPAIQKLHREFGEFFSDLRGVRNTTQHMEDRSRGLGAGRNPQPLDLKPIDNRLIKAAGGALVLNSLNGTKYGNTMADAHFGEVDVSPASMEALTLIFQRILDAFSWKGPKNHLPNI